MYHDLHRKITKAVCFGFFVLLQFYTRAQSPTASPYSRFGIGEIEKKGFGQITAMGGSYIALVNDTSSPLYINTGNPASYTSLKSTVFEVGAQNTYSTFYSPGQNVNKNNTTLNYISLGFPIKHRGGGAFGLLPFSNVGYKVTHQNEVPTIGTVTEQYEGSGGLNQLFLGLAVRPFYHPHKKGFLRKAVSNLSMGANGYYVFGNFNNTGRLIYPDGLGIYNTKRSKDTQVNDTYASAGMQMHFDIDSLGKRDLQDNVRITFGYTVSLPANMHASATTVGTTFIYGTFQREYTRDTMFIDNGISGRIKLPLMHGVGLAIKKGDRFTLLADAEYQQWSSYRFYNEVNTFKNSMRYSIGAQFVPSRATISTSYFKRMHYRLGARYSDGFLEVKNKRINDYAVTAGFGLPVGRYKFIGKERIISFVNLSFEYGQAGTLQNNLIQQKYVRAVVGFTFNDRWFIKTKYD